MLTCTAIFGSSRDFNFTCVNLNHILRIFETPTVPNAGLQLQQVPNDRLLLQIIGMWFSQDSFHRVYRAMLSSILDATRLLCSTDLICVDVQTFQLGY